jgi:hypothetical protein
MDDELRGLERAARDARDDTSVWIRYVRALDRKHAEAPDDLSLVVRRVRASFADTPEHATIDEGDEVLVDEHDTPWIVGPWRGIVTKVHLRTDERTRGEFLSFRVRPLFPDEDDPDAEPLKYRTRPLPEQRVRGLELARADRLSLIARKR